MVQLCEQRRGNASHQVPLKMDFPFLQSQVSGAMGVVEKGGKRRPGDTDSACVAFRTLQPAAVRVPPSIPGIADPQGCNRWVSTPGYRSLNLTIAM